MKRIENARILFFDENPVRRLLEFRSESYPLMLRVLDIVYERKIQMAVSPVTLSNLCACAISKKNEVLVREYREFFTRSSLLLLREFDAEVAVQSAVFRGKYDVGFEESVQLATAFVCGADLVLSENAKWKDVQELNTVLLSELV